MSRCAVWKSGIAPEGEREEIRQIFHAKGFRGDALDSAVDDRQAATLDRDHDDRGAWPAAGQPLSGQGVGAFILCGAIPLLHFVAGAPASLLTSTLMTGATFFSIGSLRNRWSPSPWWRAGIETFLIGITAAFLAYLVGALLSGLVSSAG